MGFLSSIWQALKPIFLGLGKLLGGLMPFNSDSKLPPVIRYLVYFLFVAVILVVLYFINDWARIGPAVGPLFARRIYLPILGVLLILIGVVIYLLYQLGQTEEKSPFRHR